MRDPRHPGAEWPPPRLCRQVRAQEAPSVVGPPERDDVAPAGVEAGGSERGLGGLGARVGEEDLLQVARRDLAELPGGLGLGTGDVERGGVAQPSDLLAHRLHQAGMAVSQRGGQDPGEVVEVLPALRVLHPDSPSLLKHERTGVVLGHTVEDVLPLGGEDLLSRGRSGRGGVHLVFSPPSPAPYGTPPRSRAVQRAGCCAPAPCPRETART